jgi:uncharacterized protein YehS (DUF1456 family)
MTYKAYIDNIKAQTGKDLKDFEEAAKTKGFLKNGKLLIKHNEVVAWLKKDYNLGHGHANAIVLYLKYPGLAKKKIERGE